jgi:hypothetical protein
MEYWNDGIMGLESIVSLLPRYSNIPLFHVQRLAKMPIDTI